MGIIEIIKEEIGGFFGNKEHTHKQFNKSAYLNENFWNWFGLSKVVDENQFSKPLVLYHQTDKDFDAFIPGGANRRTSGKGIWFAPEKHRSELPAYGGEYFENSSVLPVYLKMEDPLILDTPQKFLDFRREYRFDTWFPYVISDVQINKLISDGYDGIMFSNQEFADKKSKEDIESHENIFGKYNENSKKFKIDEYIAFQPTQVKSAIGNNGDFDPNNPDVTK